MDFKTFAVGFHAILAGTFFVKFLKKRDKWLLIGAILAFTLMVWYLLEKLSVI